MKKILLLLSFFLPFSLFAYYGNAEKFLLSENSICLDAPEEASTAYISMDSQVSGNATWQTQILLTFSPTSSNYLKWFLLADSANVNSSSNAYYILFGGTKRTISFYHLKSGKSSLVYQCQEMLLNNAENKIDINVTRSELDNWTVEYNINDTLSSSFEFVHNQVNYSSYSGFHCVYTKTRSKGFCFNDFSVVGETIEKPLMPKLGDLLINEILFNPEGDGVDFIEIINTSDTVIDLSYCMLGNKKQTYPLPYYLLCPDSLVAITKDTLILCEQYNCLANSNLIQVEKMLPLPNDSGYIRILSDTILIDTLFYKSDMHHPYINNVEGLSLERNSDGFWTSASTIIRATPGYKNSVLYNSEDTEDTEDVFPEFNEEELYNFYLKTSTFSVYNSEYPQNITIYYTLKKPARVAVNVFSLSGYPVCTIIDSELLSGEGSLSWSGISENSTPLPVGIYVVVLEVYDEKGTLEIKKLPIALTP